VNGENEQPHCSFCGNIIPKGPGTGVAGPEAFICRDCIGLCAEVMAQDPEWREQKIEALKELRDKTKA
jgi:ribosomal protein L24E